MSGSFVRVNRKLPCPVCGHTDWCLISPDGKTVLCPRVESAEWRGNKGGGFLHRLSTNHESPNPAAIKRAVTKAANTVERREVKVLDKVYRAFLAELKLSELHFNLLRKRGFSEHYIERENFKSFPPRPLGLEIAARLNRQFSLAGIPGFFQNDTGAWELISFGNAEGFLIPILSATDSICALQLRRSDMRTPKYLLLSSAKVEKGRNGSPSGVPAHFAFPEHRSEFSQTTEIILTEGALKARAIAHLAHKLALGLVSTTCFNDGLPAELRNTFPSLAHVSIAYDMDALRNAHVLNQRDRLCGLLSEAGFAVSILTWDARFKGLDDFLLDQLKQNNYESTKWSH